MLIRVLVCGFGSRSSNTATLWVAYTGANGFPQHHRQLDKFVDSRLRAKVVEGLGPLV
jgi:hypothetical protein